jgi:hypothetical protein
MAPYYDELAYVIGKHMIIEPQMDFDSEAMRLARSYVHLRSPQGTEEAMQVIGGFLRGVYATRNQSESAWS